MKRIGIENVILNYFQEHRNTWIKKGDLYALSYEYGYSPEYLGRSLRLMEEQGTLKVGYYDGKYSKNLAQYCYGGVEQTKTIYEEVEIDGERKMVVKQQKILA
jgi:DNA-binding transcriptional regulator PaaX